MTSVEELALPVNHTGDFTRDGRAIYVDVEDIQKDADSRFTGVELLDGDNLSVRWGNHHMACRSNSLGISEEI